MALIVVALAFGPDKAASMPRWKAFWNASPNEIGDTIAGVAGTLAFLWIIVTVMIQGKELGLQRRELILTRQELKAQRLASEEMAIAQSAQVSALRVQEEIFRDEMTARERLRKIQILKSKIHNLKLYVILDFRRRFVWEFNIPGYAIQPLKIKFFSDQSHDDLVAKLPSDDAVFFAELPAKINRTIRDVLAQIGKADSYTSPSAIYLKEFDKRISEILEYSEFCEEGKLYVDGCQISEFHRWVVDKLGALPFDDSNSDLSDE